MADHITRWAVRTADDRVLEPSCGDAQFLRAAGHRLRGLGSPTVEASQIHGVELHAESARLARSVLEGDGIAAQVSTGDFFEAPLSPGFDAVIGNPPYVRYQGFTGQARRSAQQAALAQGVRLSGLASSWAAFTVRAAGLLAPTGRLGLVLPAELLTVNYAAPVRRYLLQRFGSVRLVMFDERVFPGVLAEVVLLLAEGRGGTREIEISQARNLDALGGPPSIRWAPPSVEAKWSPALMAASATAVYLEATEAGSFRELRHWGSTDLGMVTGSNDYFTLSLEQAREAGLRESELLRVSPPGSRHLRGLDLSERAWAELAEDGRRVLLFAPGATPSPAASAYITEGERQGVHTAYKCRVRTPWWAVPGARLPDLFLTYMNADTPRIIGNGAGVAYLNSVHGIRLSQPHRAHGRELLPLAALNSLTVLGAELVGRSYGGGILKLEPREADVLPVPSPELVGAAAEQLRALRPRLAADLRQGRLAEAITCVDRIPLVEGLGLTPAELAELREARAVFSARRMARGGRA